LVHNFSDAQAADKDLGLEVAADVLKVYEALPKKIRSEIQSRVVFIKSIKQKMTFKDVLGVAFHYGNESNYEKMLSGYAMKREGLIPWTPETIDEILSHLREEHWDYVQNVGDVLQKLWPASSALEKRQTGLAPPEIERRPFTRTFEGGRKKTYDGYYAPVIPHPDFAKLFAEKQTGPDGGPFESWHTRAMTPHGHLIERTGAVFPVSLNILRIPGHIAQVIHDTTHREAIVDAWRLLSDPRIANKIVYRMGVDAYREMLSRVKKTANARGMLDFDGDRLGWSEAQLAASLMGWKVTTALQNFANLGIALHEGGYIAFGRALAEFIHDPRGTLDFIQASSGEMKHRFTTRDNETRREFERAVVGESWGSMVRRTGYYMASFTNSLIDNPFWLAKYRTEMKNGATHDEAVRTADSAVRTNFGAGGVKDLAHYQDSPVWKHLTMFTGWFSSQYNAERRVIRETRGLIAEEKYTEAAGHFLVAQFYRIVVMAIASEVLSGRGPRDDEDEWEWALMKIALYQASLMPIVKEIGSGLDFGTDPRFGGIGSLGKIVADAIEASVKAGTARTVKSLGKAVAANAKLMATAKGWPAAQAEITGGTLAEVAAGNYRYRGAGTFIHDLLFRRDKKRRR
jgi:hypothetical protein